MFYVREKTICKFPAFLPLEWIENHIIVRAAAARRKLKVPHPLDHARLLASYTSPAFRRDPRKATGGSEYLTSARFLFR